MLKNDFHPVESILDSGKAACPLFRSPTLSAPSEALPQDTDRLTGLRRIDSGENGVISTIAFPRKLG
jgi:hypothetical protein